MNLDYTIEDVAKITHGTIRGNLHAKIDSIFIDSRNHFNPKNKLFIAINGNYNDGHDYLVELYNKGLRNFIIERDSRKGLIQKAGGGKRKNNLDYIDANIIVVENSIKALQEIAAHHRKKFDIPVIGITGSNGKTIVKEWLYHFLRNDFNIVRSPKSYNSQVGVPLSVLQMTDKHTLAIFEAGISQQGEMVALEKIISPTHGILTNIGTSHLENFANSVELKNEKLVLFKNCDYIFTKEKNTFPDVTIQKDNNNNNNNSLINTYFGNINVQYRIPFTNYTAIDNSLTCIAFLLNFGIDMKSIASKALSLPQIALRLETRKGKKGNVIIIDNYNSDIESLRIALDYLDRSDKSKNKQLILSDLKQDKVDSLELYQGVAELVNERKIDTVVGIGKEITKNRTLFDKGYFHETTSQYISDTDLSKIENTVILTKGAQAFHFEKIGHLLEEKKHETVLEINLNSIAQNVKTYKDLLRPETKLLVMVKAFGYGAGSKELGQVLQRSKVDYLGVAYTDEGTDLRKEGIDLPILVMNAEKGSFEDVIENNLEPSIFSFRQLDDFIRKLIDLGVKEYPIHIKIDTGMSRLGFVENEIDNLISIIASQPEVHVKSVFSHLAASDDVKHDDFTLQQINLLDSISQKLEESLDYKFIKHILNSAGIERFPEHQMGMVRLGIGIYGQSAVLKNLEVVGRLKTIISQVKRIKKGTSIGYSRSDFAEKDMTIGILPIGYADGFKRNLSNGNGHVFINGKLAPVIGKVCMDMTIIDLSEIDAKEGDEVEIFGANRPIADLAKEMDTISYEVMTSISERVVRVYLED